jgi:hypothetical protein
MLRVDEDVRDDGVNGADVLGPKSAFLRDAFVGLASAPPTTIRALTDLLRAQAVIPAAPRRSAAHISQIVRMLLGDLGHLDSRVDRVTLLADDVWDVRGTVQAGTFLASADDTGYVTSVAVTLRSAGSNGV